MRTLLTLAIRAYRYGISPYLGAHCRFEPSCSRYAEIAIARFGVLRGGRMALRRLSRCHPWHAGGIDPVPERGTQR
ncbi:MAG: membrane protein insertion efficiency factor YidD [Gammaproteobacteria bacterium]|nr:membrane protein insertion efficiency factor YidD [Gammaproteobacteria bacterium]